MNGNYLLSDKFTPPELPEICAQRQALLDTFRREADKRVIFVSAPAGYGKTVSMLLWIKSSGRKAIWIGLDQYDNSPSIFYKLFCTGILSLQPENKAMADILKSPEFAFSPVEHTISLLSEFAPDDKQYAVVLDDVHLVTGDKIRKSGFLVRKRLPLSFVTLFLTRNEVAEEYILASGNERPNVITARDLAFSEEEIHKYFNSCGRFISMKEAVEAHAVTSGWPIGVKALAMSGQMDIGQKGGQILENYIKRQIWDKWDEDLRDFMLKTSVVDEMTAEICERLTGRDDAGEVLTKLYRLNSFVSKTNDDTYRYHHLFLEFLQNMLEQTDNINGDALYKTASNYFLEADELFAARRYAIKSGDSEAIANASYALMQNNGKSISIDEYVNFYKSFEKDMMMPESFCDKHPFIYSTYAWFYFLSGDADKMARYMDKVYQYMPVIARSYPKFIEMTVLSCVIDCRASFSKQMERFRSFPVFSCSGDTLQVSSIFMGMPYAHRSVRDYHELMDESDLRKLARTFGPLLKSQYKVVVLELRSGFLYERNMLNEALETALKTGSIINDGTTDELAFCGFMHMASIYYAMKNKAQFKIVIAQTEQYIKKLGAYYLRPNFLAYKTKILLMDGHRIAALRWLENYFVIEAENLELYKIFEHFTTARAYMVLAQTDKAMKYILKLKQLGTDFIRPVDIAEATILQAALEWALGKKKEAQETLETALTSMQQYGFVRVFADEGAAILPILRKIALRQKKESYQGPLNAQYLSAVTIAAYEHSKWHKGIAIHINQKPVRLSNQQRLILTLLSKGYQYREIMEKTGLTIHTVKSHASAAYAKLDVHNSIDAVLKARELGIIEQA